MKEKRKEEKEGERGEKELREGESVGEEAGKLINRIERREGDKELCFRTWSK